MINKIKSSIRDFTCDNPSVDKSLFRIKKSFDEINRILCHSDKRHNKCRKK